ncbi:ribose-5-phosphate isomerase RpiA [Paenibacillus polymyxa]|uniref:ribose-5-phosphate isomerase RpiA n=1 Tax=Paenibacillus polymyxa TaxID=1406 RepID=UPI0027D7A363|nr:ribose-5-phosphate isomerase RpiA [Paenibacillus polymyxa]
MADIEAQKKRAALHAAAEVRDGMVLGLGTGSTATYAVREIGRRVSEESLLITATATSAATGALAVALGIPLRPMGDFAELDLVIDGADEIDPSLRAIKGGGGAHFREKIAVAASHRTIIVVDSSKPVETLGKFALPIEVHPFALGLVQRQLQRMVAMVTLRLKPDGAPFLTDQQAYVLDAKFGTISDPVDLAMRIQALPGVLAHGLFIDLIHEVVIGLEDGVRVEKRHENTPHRSEQ